MWPSGYEPKVSWPPPEFQLAKVPSNRSMVIRAYFWGIRYMPNSVSSRNVENSGLID